MRPGVTGQPRIVFHVIGFLAVSRAPVGRARLSVAGYSVVVVDGGFNEQPKQPEQPESTQPQPESAQPVQPMSVLAARSAADAAALEADPFLADAFARLNDAVKDL